MCAFKLSAYPQRQDTSICTSKGSPKYVWVQACAGHDYPWLSSAIIPNVLHQMRVVAKGHSMLVGTFILCNSMVRCLCIMEHCVPMRLTLAAHAKLPCGADESGRRAIPDNSGSSSKQAICKWF